MVNGLLIAITVIFAWIFLMILLSPYIRKTKRLSLIGPLLMIKAIKKRGVLDGIAQRFPAVGFSRFSVVLKLATGIFAIGFLFYGAYLSSLITTPVTEPLTYYLGLPGINPIIPVTYGIPAFGFAMVIHEIFHGIVARKHDMKVNSVGLLLFVVPIGAFVEPDEKEMNAVDPVVRRRVFASGAGINIVIGIAMMLVLAFIMMPGAQPVHDGLYVQAVSANQPYPSLIQPGDEIISYANYSGNSITALLEGSSLVPGTLHPMEIFNGTNVRTVQYPAGLSIDSTLGGFPANESHLAAGSVIYSINGTMIYNISQMTEVLDGIMPNSTISVVTVNYAQTSNGLNSSFEYYNLTTVTKYSYYEKYDPSANKEQYRNQSFIGVTTSYLAISGIQLNSIKPVIFLKNVFTDPWYGFISSIALPLSGLSPVPHHLAQLFNTPFSPLVFWGLVNTIYWLYWVNVLLGVTNALPVLILDGNQFFKDTFFIAGRRKRLSFLRNERVLNRIMGFLNVLVIFLILYELIVPRII